MMDSNSFYGIDNAYAGTRCDWIVIDVESDRDCNALEISIIGGDGTTCLSSQLNPLCYQGFIHAGKQLPQRLLDRAPTLDQMAPLIEELTANKTCIMWNAKHDISCLPNCFSRAKNIVCAMERFAMLNGQYSMRYGTYKYVSLAKALDVLNLDWPNGVRHRSWTDAEALRLVWQWMESTTVEHLLEASLKRQQRPDPFPF